MDRPYEIIEHSGDLKLRVFGKTLKDLYLNAACGLGAALAGKIATNKSSHTSENVFVESGNSDDLLVDFLNVILYQSDIHNSIFKIKIIELTEYRVRAEITQIAKGPFAIEIKGVTHHGMEIRKITEGYSTEILFDL